MSVLKNKRRESPFEVFAHGYRLRRSITDLLLRDFGYKHKVREHETERQQERRKAFEIWFLQKHREYILDTLRNLMREINWANKMYPTNLRELEERRLHQDNALAECSNLSQELQYIIETLPVNIDRYLPFDALIQRQIMLIKAWRKSDNKYKAKLN